METQNVTLALPKELLRKAKVVAAQRNTSLSKLLTHALEDMVNEDVEYQRAMESALHYLANAQPMGPTEARDWSRDDLHER